MTLRQERGDFRAAGSFFVKRENFLAQWRERSEFAAKWPLVRFDDLSKVFLYWIEIVLIHNLFCIGDALDLLWGSGGAASPPL